MAKSTAPDSESKPAWRPVEHTEEARKAQRASLTWSGLTIVAGFGEYITPSVNSAAQSEHVRLLPFNLHYDQWQLVLMLWIASLVYTLFYARAERVVRLANSEAARKRATTWDEALELADSVKQEVSGMEALAKSIRRKHDDLKPAIDEYAAFLTKRIEDMREVTTESQSTQQTRYQNLDTQVRKAAVTFTSNAERIISAPDYDPSVGDLEMIAHDMQNEVQSAAGAYSMDVDDRLSTAKQQLTHEMALLKQSFTEKQPLIEKSETNLDVLKTSVTKLHRDLTSFRRGVDRPERFFYIALDVGLVGIAFLIATILTISHVLPAALAWLGSLWA